MSQEFEKKLKRISQIFLESKDKMIKEKDLLSYVQDESLLEEIISDLLDRFDSLGYEIIRTSFLNEKYYILTTEGMDKKLTPQMYGALSIILSINRELGKDLSIKQLKKIFDPVWEEIEFLIEEKYLHKYTGEEHEYLTPTPIAKVLFKNFISDMSIDKILDILGISD